MNDSRYDDVLPVRYARGTDLEAMRSGCHYDYRAQAWVDGHDHGHVSVAHPELPIMFCGADAATCAGAGAR